MEDRALNTTTKIFAAFCAFTLAAAPTLCWAGSQSVALAMLMGAASLGDDGNSAAVKQADDLLREARQAMNGGNLDAAASKIAQADALRPKYPLFYSGDTPKRAHADLEKLAAQKGKFAGKTAASGKSGASSDPFLTRPSVEAAGTSANSLAETTSGSNRYNPPAAQGRSTEPGMTAQQLAARGYGSQGSMNSSSPGVQSQTSPANRLSSIRDEGPNPWDIEPPNVPTLPGSTSPSTNMAAAASPPPGDSIPTANEALGAVPISTPIESPTGMVGSRYANAPPLVSPDYYATNDNPAAATGNLQSVPGTLAPAATLGASAMKMAGDGGKAQALELTAEARKALSEGNAALAERLAHQAETLAPDSAYAPREDRPSLVLLDIQRAKKQTSSGVIHANGNASDDSRYPALRGLRSSGRCHTKHDSRGTRIATCSAACRGK